MENHKWSWVEWSQMGLDEWIVTGWLREHEMNIWKSIGSVGIKLAVLHA